MSDSFRRFRVLRKVPESTVITSFHLAAVDGRPLWAAKPGQYLTLRIPAPNGTVLRTYSLSCPADADDFYRISVKREAGMNGAPDGIGSIWLHDHLAEGDEIEIAAPRGAFVLDETSERPVVLLAGGVGLTPLLSMLHRLVKTGRKAWFIHAIENGGVQALREEVASLAAASEGRISVCNVFRVPTEEDRIEGLFGAEGVVDQSLLQRLLPLDDYQVYLCGPTPFMVAMWRLLISLGIAQERIAYEFFGKGGSLADLAAKSTKATQGEPIRIPMNAPKSLAKLDFILDPDALAVPEPEPKPRKTATQPSQWDGGDEVVFARSGTTLAWNPGTATILELAENAGLNPDFSCRAGICNTCRCAIREGKVEYIETPLDRPPPGEVLICCSRPVGRVVLDL